MEVELKFANKHTALPVFLEWPIEVLLTVENQIFIWQKAGHVKEMKIILTFSLPFKMLMYALYYHILCKKVTSEIKYIWYHSEKYPLFTW